MSTLSKGSLMFGVGLLVGAFKAFVLTVMWNWFVSPVFHTSEVSFWEMLGLLWVVQLFVDKTYDDNPATKLQWENLFLILDTCVPVERREDLKLQLQEKNEEIWTEIGAKIFGSLAGSAFVLGLGFAVHTFFMER
jgi:hypothetical protein